MPRNPVLVHVSNAKAAGQRNHVDPADILGILDVEGGTDQRGRPVVPQDGAGPASFGQFTFGTGRSLKVVYGNSRSETDAIARYLNQVGYQKDRVRAIAAYNGGPGNPQYDYAKKVTTAAKRYTGIKTGVPASSSDDASPVDAPAPQDTSSGKLVDDTKRSGALKALLWVCVVAAGAVLFGLGASRTFGLHRGSGAST